MMDPNKLQYWLRRKPLPTLIKIYEGDKVREFVKDESQNWGDAARSIMAVAPDKIEVYDAKGNMARAVRFDDEEDEEEEKTKGRAPTYDDETERLKVVAGLIADAYKFATGVAFDKMIGLFDGVSRQTEAQAKALNETNRLLGKAYQEQVEMALEQAEQHGEGDPLNQMVAAVLTGAQQGATERNVVKSAIANRAANGKPTNGSPTNGKAQI